MLQPGKVQLLTDEQRTVTFSEQEAKAIYRIIQEFDPNSIADAVEDVFQQLLNNSAMLDADLGDEYFALRRIKSFYADIHQRLTAIYDAFAELPLSVRAQI